VLVPPVATDIGFMVCAAVAVVSAISMMPGEVHELIDSSVKAHHLQHAAQFLLGGVLGLGLMSRWRLMHPRWAGASATHLTAAVVAPIVMLIVMTPSIYEPLSDHPVSHFLFHIGFIGLGVITGWSSVPFGRMSGMTIFLLSMSMGFLFAGGVGGVIA